MTTSPPISATGNPTGVISKMASGGRPCFTSSPEIVRLADVPIVVMTPPSSAA